ncbi:putative RNA-directed DNA polymerase from transposon BS-like 6, partial [Homarus americanus]
QQKLLAKDLVLVVKGRHHITKAQRALELISEKCMSLGLKISIPKLKAMRIGSNDPGIYLKIEGTVLQWVNVCIYLGIWIDKGLKFDKEIHYLRERMGKRVHTMRVMTGPKIPERNMKATTPHKSTVYYTDRSVEFSNTREIQELIGDVYVERKMKQEDGKCTSPLVEFYKKLEMGTLGWDTI